MTDFDGQSVGTGIRSLRAIAEGGGPKTFPKVGLFGDVRPLARQLEGAPPQKVVELLFNYHSNLPDPLARALKAIPDRLRLELCRARWEECRRQGREVSWQALLVIADLGAIAADWMRAVWRELPSDDRGFTLRSLAASLPPDEAFELAKEWAGRAADAKTRKRRLMAFGSLSNSRTLGLIEDWWQSADPGAPVSDDWGRLAADSRMDWPTAQTWLERGRPLSLIALDALLDYLPRSGYPQVPRPADFDPPDLPAFRAVLTQYQDRDNTPRVDRIVRRLLDDAHTLIG